MAEQPIEQQKVEAQAVSLFRIERREDVWAISLAALRVLFMVLGVRF